MIGTWRQQQAKEVYQDGVDLPEKFSQQAFDDAVDIATTVKITQDAIDALDEKVSAGDIHGGAVALLTALGFEIVQ